jgi:hypothetical protein
MRGLVGFLKSLNCDRAYGLGAAGGRVRCWRCWNSAAIQWRDALSYDRAALARANGGG